MVNWTGIKYQISRFFGMTEYDKEIKKIEPKKSLAVEESLVKSLEISPLNDLPVLIGARVAYVSYFILTFCLVYFLVEGFRTAKKETFYL